MSRGACNAWPRETRQLDAQSKEQSVEAVRGVGTLILLLGGAGVLTKFSARFRFRPSVYPELVPVWRWSGRIGAVMLGLGALLVLISWL
jgi:hypothetical protein